MPPLLEHEVPIPSFSYPVYLLCTSEEIHQLLLTISLNKAPGPDGISAHMLKSTAYSIAYPLSRIFNSSLQTGKLPSE